MKHSSILILSLEKMHKIIFHYVLENLLKIKFLYYKLLENLLC